MSTHAHFQYKQMKALMDTEKRYPTRSGIYKASQAKLIKTFKPQGEIRSVAICGDGTSVVTASIEGTIQWWDTFEGNEDIHRRIHGVSAFFPSRGQDFIMTESWTKSFGFFESRNIQIHDINKKRVVHDVSASSKVKRAEFSNTGRFVCESEEGLVAGDTRKTTQGKLRMSCNPGTVRHLSLSADGNFLAIVLSNPCKTKIWNLSTGEKVTEIGGEPAQIALSSDGLSIAIVSLDQSMELIDVRTGEVINKISFSKKNRFPQKWRNPRAKTLHEPEEQSTISISADCCYLAVGYNDCKIVVWEIRTGNILNSFHASTGFSYNRLSCISFSADNSYIVSGCVDSDGSRVQVWDVLPMRVIFVN